MSAWPRMTAKTPPRRSGLPALSTQPAPGVPDAEISVVIPCYCSAQTLPLLVPRVHEALSGVANYEVILVVDGSPDDTYRVAEALHQASPEHVRTVLLRRNYGQHNALLAGILRASYSIVVTMDDDLQHRPEQILRLVAPLLESDAVDLVYGVAEEEEHGLMRSAASRVVKAGLALSGVPSVRDVSAYRAFRAELREGFSHVADPYFSLDVVLSWATVSTVRVSCPMDERRIGSSAYTLRSLVRHSFNMITGYGTMPLKLVTWLGVFTSLLGFGLFIFMIAKYLWGEILVAGFTTLACMLAILSGAMMMSIGIIGEYLGRLHFRSMNKPTFLVRRDSGLRSTDAQR